MNPIGLLQDPDLVQHVGLDLGEHQRLELFEPPAYRMRPERYPPVFILRVDELRLFRTDVEVNKPGLLQRHL